MPRQPKPTAATLEHQPTAALGDLDENGIERLPTFGEPQPTRGETLADLDARDAALNSARPPGLNGTVRPSEQCRTPSPLGIGCTHRIEHGGLHSWTPEPVHQPEPGQTHFVGDECDPAHTAYDPKRQPANSETCRCGHIFGLHDQGSVNWHCESCHCGSFRGSNEVDKQPVLPGTPEPEQNEYSVPLESAFGGKDLVAAPGLKAIAERLIADDSSLEHLVGVEIRYFWRRRGGTQGGNPRYGAIKRPGVYEAYFTGGKVVYLLALAADHVREARFTDKQIEACAYSQLVKTDVDPDDHDAYRIVGVDFSGTVRELERFGTWSPDLREMHAHVARLPLELAIDEACADEGEDGE